MNNTSRETLTGSGGGDAAISVSLSEDGTYQIAASSSKVVIALTGQTSGELECPPERWRDCFVDVKNESRNMSPAQYSVGGVIQVAGRVDPKTPNVLAGSKTEETPNSQGARGKTVKTTTWQFRRQ